MPSGRVSADPQEMRRFANSLKEFNSLLSESIGKLNGQFRSLGETWRDPAYAKFAQEFESTLNELRRFEKVASEVIPNLQRTADRIDEVHRQ